MSTPRSIPSVAMTALLWLTATTSAHSQGGSCNTPPATITSTPGCSGISVAWSASPFAWQYQLIRNTSPSLTGPGFVSLGSTIAGTSFLDSSAAVGTTYYYSVQAWCAIGGFGGFGAWTSATRQAVTAPANLTASNGTNCGGVQLSWGVVPYATSYRVQRSTSSGSTGSVIGTPATNSFLDSSATAGVTYFYRVAAVTSCGVGPLAGPVAGSRPATPAAPSFASASIAGSATSSPFVDEGAFIGSPNYYWVVATNTCGSGVAAAAGPLAPANCAPVLQSFAPTTVIAGSNTSLSLTVAGVVNGAWVEFQRDLQNLGVWFAVGTSPLISTGGNGSYQVNPPASVWCDTRPTRILVFNPGTPNGVPSNAMSIPVLGPGISSITPAFVSSPSGLPVTLTVSGTVFDASSRIYINGVAMITSWNGLATGQLTTVVDPGSTEIPNVPIPGYGASGGLTITVFNHGRFLSNSKALEIGDGVTPGGWINSGVIETIPGIAPTGACLPATTVDIRIEAASPGTSFSLLLYAGPEVPQAWAYSPLTPGSALKLNATIFATGSMLLLDGLGLAQYLPNPGSVAPGSAIFQPHPTDPSLGYFLLRTNWAVPTAPLGLRAHYQAYYLDPASPEGWNATWPRTGDW